MSSVFRLVLVVCLLSAALVARSQDMDIHVLSRPDAAALVPVIQPLLPAGGSVRAYQGKLILRTTDANLAELQSVLGGLEATPSAMVVHLRRQGSQTSRQQGVQGSISGSYPGKVQGEVRIESRQQHRQQQDHYQIRTLSGYPAHISQGTLLALGRGYYGTMLAGLEQGIQVIPQLAPNGSVVLQISQRYDQPGGAGLAHTQSSATTLRVQPGVWQPMGSITVESQEDQRGLSGTQSHSQRVTLPLEVMVEIQ